jgi:hypothetical protein
MRNLLFLLPISILLAGCAGREVPATKLEKANVLPLAIDEAFQFRKQKLSFYSAQDLPRNQSEAVTFENRRMEWGAIDENDREQLYGNYFSFFWRATREADVTVRLEYRQAALGNYVMAQERYYPAARGSYQSDFQVTGDDFLEMGRVTSWRALLIVDGRIVGLSQSFIWK